MAADTSGTVNILMENVPDTDIVKSLIPEFNKKYPNIKVTIEPQTYDQIRDKLVASFQAPKATYDLVVVDNVWMKDFVAANWLQPLDSRIDSTPDYDYADFFKPLTDIDTVDGKRYAVPFYNYALGYIYNVPDYQKAGLTEPKTLDDLVANSRSWSPASAPVSPCNRSGATRCSRNGRTSCSPLVVRSTTTRASTPWTPRGEEGAVGLRRPVQHRRPEEQPELGLRRGRPIGVQWTVGVAGELQLEPAVAERT